MGPSRGMQGTGASNDSLTKKLFSSRVELITELDKYPDHNTGPALRSEVAERLRQEVEQMNVNTSSCGKSASWWRNMPTPKPGNR